LFRRNRVREGEDHVGSGWFYFPSFSQGRESEICRLREGKTLTKPRQLLVVVQHEMLLIAAVVTHFWVPPTKIKLYSRMKLEK